MEKRGGLLLVNTKKVNARILELSLTQEIVAKELGITYTTLNLKINNKRRLYIDEMIKLCDVLNITTTSELKEYFGLDFLIVFNSCEKATCN